MLIRTATNALIEYPDELGAPVLADEGQNDAQPTPLDEANLVVNVVLGLLYEETRTLDENIAHARAHLTRWGTPDDAAMQKALEQIKAYNENIPITQIGYASHELIDYYFLSEPKCQDKPYTIAQNARDLGALPALAAPTGP